jgi:hypothetical protein
LLIVDNASHPRSELSKRESGKFKVMDRGITETLRKLYRKQLLRRLLLCDGDENDMPSFCKILNLKV